MNTILQSSAIDKLPMNELAATLDVFMGPVLAHLPEKRLRKVGKLGRSKFQTSEVSEGDIGSKIA
ncbi:MAG: hypothetical protein B6I35_03495 [Anaerolineaceae bacterium 4572_32.2]|nr:MAG: hypothetical protein B6I35_03495 [Anaerolineaceae bacterium 4572_32.2]HEY72053.1 hypothetical protein [Thermoflexia bacterium]